MTRLILIRHGQSEANLNIWWAGHTDAPLTELGHAQAAAAAHYLREHEQIDAVYASDLRRAMDTARPTAEAFGLSITPERGLREIFGGAWEELPFSVINEKYAADRSLWYTDLGNALCTDGETVAALYRRVVDTVTRIAEENDGKTVLIAAHWTPILAMICHALGRDPSEIGDCPEPYNASIQIISYEHNRFKPVRLNITEHLGDMLPKPSQKRPTRLIVVRHGFSVSNAERRYTGQQDVPLSPLGHEQAALLADRLAVTERITAVYSSDLVRAMDTVTPTAKRFGLSVIPERGLRETDVGDWTGRTYEEVAEQDAALLERHRLDPGVPCPGGECHRAVFERVTNTVKRILEENAGGCVLLATHAMPARCIEAMSAGHGIEEIRAHRVAPNASFRIYTYRNGKLFSQGRNVVSHLEKPGESLPDELV